MLTEQQQRVVDADGDFLLLACPGSGKTRSAAERVARLQALPGSRLAVCSYTNVGAQRIGGVLSDLGVLLDGRHFLGTIHGFLLRFVVYPFGHLIGAGAGPRVREEAWPDVAVFGDNRKRIDVDAFRMSPDGQLVITNKPRTVPEDDTAVVASVGAEVRRIKREAFKASGALTSDDAMWAALSILRSHPAIRDAVAGRFSELLLDEAQDTSELQLACLAELRGTGRLRSMVLVGDLEQSIYSFQGASAAGCQELAESSGLATIKLTENHRSSQRICDVAVHFSARTHADRAVGPHRDCDVPPEVLLYPKADVRATRELFRARLAEHGIEAEHAAILTRARQAAASLNGEDKGPKLRDRARRLGRIAAALRAGYLTAGDVRALESLLSYCAYGVTDLSALDDDARRSLRRETHRLIMQLPPLTGTLRDWMRSANVALQERACALCTPPAHSGATTVPAGATLEGHNAADLFSESGLAPRAQTVHSIKGEDREAVMVVIRTAHATDSQLALWEATAAGEQVDEAQAEERRVTFVALTRAQRYCLVALPDDRRGRALAQSCVDLGFVAV